MSSIMRRRRGLKSPISMLLSEGDGLQHPHPLSQEAIYATLPRTPRRLSCSSLIALEAPSEELDVMERSPDLPLHFADENLEPSASYGANAVADQVAAAIKRSTSPGERVAPPQPVAREIRTPSLSNAAPPETFAKIKTETAAVEMPETDLRLSRSPPGLSWQHASACISEPSRISSNLCCRNATVWPHWLANSPWLAATLQQRLCGRARPPRKRIGLGRRRTP